MQNAAPLPQGRVESIDAMRGWIMFLLIAEGFGFTHLLDYPFWGAIGTQFTHHTWHGFYFWDLVQPLFMFIVGVAMPFAIARRSEKGDSHGQIFRHVLRRSFTLLLLGIFLGCYYSKGLNLSLVNVLAQLSFTYLIAFVLIRRPLLTQFLISIAILLVYDLAYRWFPYAAYFPDALSPWDKHMSLGALVELNLIGTLNKGGWVTLNAVSTAVHTIWGVGAGLWLKSKRDTADKLMWLLIAGVALTVAGLALDPVTPIIKRIATSTFVLFSGGLCVLLLAGFYWLVDVKKQGARFHFMTIVGMNSIFIYLFIETLGHWTRDTVAIFTAPFKDTGAFGILLTANIAIYCIWYLCKWLYKNRVFIKI